MTDRRYNAWPALHSGPNNAVQVVRSYDGRVFGMSVQEARDLATALTKAADQAEARRTKTHEGTPA